MHGVKSSSAIKAEPISQSSNAEPSCLKRLHGEEATKQPQCTVMKMSQSEDVKPTKATATYKSSIFSSSIGNVVRGKLVPLICKYCNTYFLSKSELNHHISSEHKGIELKSTKSFFISLNPKPNFQFQTSYSALESFYEHFCKCHLKSEHNPALNAQVIIPRLLHIENGKKQSLCTECPTQTSDTLAPLNIHVHKHCTHTSVEQCRICGLQTTELSVEDISEHLRTAHKFYYWHLVQPGGEIWQCIDCEQLSARCLVTVQETIFFVRFHFKNLTVTKSYSQNVANAPYNGVSFQCQFEESLPVHKHKAPQSHSCTVCPATFESQCQLDQHLQTHVDLVFRKCSVCQFESYNMVEYYSHVYEVHGSCLMPDIDFRSKKSQVCHKSSQFTVSNIHNRCSLQIDRVCHQNKFKSQSVVKLQCPVCDVVFLDTKLFYSHCVPYTKIFTNLPWKCIICQLNFDTEKDARAHWKNVHFERERLYCRICSLQQKSIPSLENHVAKQHNIPMIHCNLCKVNILNTAYALEHFRSCYSKSSELIICLLCGYICEDVGFFLTHVRVEFETLLPRYQCKSCLNYFYGKVNLVSHMLHGKCK